MASRKNGLCILCSLRRDPFFAVNTSLIDRVCHSPGGFDALSEAEKFYYPLTLFQDEVNNGGFHQFFFNSSGSYYDLIEGGLARLEEQQTLELLRLAKQAVFPDIAVPADMATRRELLPAPSSESGERLNELDRRFYSIPDTLTAKLQAFARERGLV